MARVSTGLYMLARVAFGKMPSSAAIADQNVSPEDNITQTALTFILQVTIISGFMYAIISLTGEREAESGNASQLLFSACCPCFRLLLGPAYSSSNNSSMQLL